MAKKDPNQISDYAPVNTDVMMRECFLRTCREVLDNAGVEQYSLDQIRGALTMMEHFVDIKKTYEK